MPLNKLRVVVYSIAYALPAWGGFVSVELQGKIDAIFKRLRRYGNGYINDNLTLSGLLDKADCDLFATCVGLNTVYNMYFHLFGWSII